MKPPRPSQWKAIQATDGHVLVTAGAGTGKTYTVVARVLYELGVEIEGRRTEAPLSLRDIAAVTFTNEAAADLKRQLRKRLREFGRQREAAEVDLARIGTIHGFCGDILRDFALRAGRPPLARALDEGEAGALAHEAAHDALLAAVEADDAGALALLATHRARDVVRWVETLLGHGGVLARASEHMPADGNAALERALLSLAGRALRGLNDRLERDGVVDFDRMIAWTRDLLRDDLAVRRALRRRIRLLIVDEFQDVDPMQREIAYLLGGLDDGDPAGAAPYTRLMLVGDPKQSVYRFRHADVTVWRRVERDFAEHGAGRVLALEDNFRSVAPVLGFVEATVGRLLDQPVSPESGRQPFEVPFRPVSADRGEGEAASPVELIVVPPGAGGKQRPVPAVRELEAAAIAARARALHDEDGVPWRDMALLLTSWSAADLYASALEAAGAFVYVLRGEGLLDAREVVDLMLALGVVRDPRDDTALLGFLRSPFVGVRDDTLLALARAGGRPYWTNLRAGDVARLDLEADEAARLERGVRLVRRYQRVRDRLRPAELLGELLSESGYLAYLALLGRDGRQPRANIEAVLRRIRDMGDAGTGEVLRALQEQRGRGDRVAPARLHAERDDVVTITTVHSAKGLEWPVVFWADLVRRPGNKTPDLLLGRDEVRLKDPDADSDAAQPPGWARLKALYQSEAQAEQRRVWYVATTRARDRLVLSAFQQGNQGGPAATAARLIAGQLQGLDDAGEGDRIPYTDAAGVRREAVVHVARPADAGAGAVTGAGADAGAGDRPDGAGADGPATAPIGDPAGLPGPLTPVPVAVGPARHSATEFLSYARCPRRHWLRYIAGIPEPPAGAPQEELIAAVRRGQIVHDVLERIAAEKELRGLLEDAIGRWDEDAPPPDSERGVAYRAHLSEEIRRVLRDPEYAEMTGRPGARRELGFLHVLGPEAVLEGRIDLAAPTPDGRALELLDVKTSQCDADAAVVKAGQYAPQRDAYVAAADELCELPVRRFVFHFSHPGRAVSEPLDDAARAAAAERVRDLAGAVTRGAAADGTPPPLTEHPHECRFCGYRRTGLCPGVSS